MTEKRPILFEAFPRLQETVSWLSLGMDPTPVHPLQNSGCPNLWIKRDDLTSPIYGGNKIRKLEFILGDVQKRKKSHVVTLGGLGTNHGLATAIFCRRLGLSCSLILFEQPVTEPVKQNLLLFHKHGADLIFSRGLLHAGIHFYLIQRLRFPTAYFLYAGGSTPIGTLGFVNAAFELKSQIQAGLIDEPKYIFCPLGSNGTLAGLALGVLLAGLESKVVGVRVARSKLGPLKLATRETVESLMKITYHLIQSIDPSVPDIPIKPPEIRHDYVGEGYGYATKEGVEAFDLMKRKEGIQLDLTYTAKTFAAVLHVMKGSQPEDGPVLYWHTYNAVDLHRQASSVDYRDLPAPFHRFFE